MAKVSFRKDVKISIPQNAYDWAVKKSHNNHEVKF